MSGVAKLMYPNLFLIGAQKSGTTSFAELLAAHPQIALAHSKEPNILGCRDEASRLPAYAKCWAGTVAGYRLDASQVYLVNPPSRERIVKLAQDQPLKVLVLLRDPVARAISAFWHMTASGIERRSLSQAFRCLSGAADLAAALAAESQNIEMDLGSGELVAHQYARRFYDEHWNFRYLHNSCYAHHLKPWLAALPEDSCRVWFTDDLRNEPARLLSDTAAFLDLSVPFAPDRPVAQANVTRVSRGTAMARLGRGVRNIVPESVRLALRPLLGSFYDRLTLARPQAAAPQLQARLRAVLAEDLAELGGILGREVPATWH